MTKLDSGMGNTKDLGAKDICGILKACHAAGVSKFELRGLKVEFEASSAVDSSTNQLLPLMENSDTEEPEVFMMTAEQEENLKEIDDVNLLMADPEAYENQMIDKLLT